jgi:hypothetical protein
MVETAGFSAARTIGEFRGFVKSLRPRRVD